MVVVRGVLEVPLHLAGGGIEGDGAFGEQIVARPVGGIVARRRIAGAPIGEVALRIVGAGDVERAAAGAPGVGLVLPGLAAGLARRRDHERLPLRVAGLGIDAGEPVAYAVVAAGRADEDRILERERRCGQLQVGLVAELLVPDDLPALLVGGDDAPIEAGHRYDQIVPQRDAAVAVGLLLPGIHLPEDAPGGSGADIDLVHHAPDVGDVHHAVVHQRRRFDIFVAGAAAERNREGELEVLDVRLVDDGERREALRAVVMMVHQPILRLGMHEALVAHVRGAQRRGARQERGQGDGGETLRG